MNREDVIRVAREAGWKDLPTVRLAFAGFNLERFASLVAAYVRETEFKPDWNNYRQGVADGAAEEREACAKVCDERLGPTATDFYGKTYAAAIRARSKHE